MVNPGPGSDQYSFTDLEPSLDEVTFVIVDLETTGGSAERDAITEIGAVKVRGGETIGEFATLVDPGRPIPPQIVMLTSITDAMVADAPPIEAVLPSFLEFAAGSALVAHNARFDIGFLLQACRRQGRPWPKFPVIDTVRLARAVFPRSEVPSVRLSVLAPLLGATVTPNHRALADARATADVLHALIGRLGTSGIDTLTELQRAHRPVDPLRRSKRHLADGIPHRPGVYLFRDADDAVLYVGTSGNLHARVRSYFTAAETRTKISTMLRGAARVDHVVCTSALEAQIREQRLIAAHQPQYNKRSKNPDRAYYLQWTTGASPRLRVLAAPPKDPAPHLGPLTSRVAARQCAQILASLQSAAAAPELFVEMTHALWAGTSDTLLHLLQQRMQVRAEHGNYDAAATVRDDLTSLITAVRRAQRLAAFTTLAEIVTAAPDGRGGWELAVIRRGRLVSAGLAGRGIDPHHVIADLRNSAETISLADPAIPAASPEESWTLLTFIDRPDVRLVHVEGTWASAAASAARWADFVTTASAARSDQLYDQL